MGYQIKTDSTPWVLVPAFLGPNLETKDSSPSYHDQIKHFPCGCTRTLRWFPVYPVSLFGAAVTAPTGLARGQSTQWHSATEGHFVL